MFTRVFGASHLAARSGALVGAGIFILASYFLSTLIAENFLLRVSLFICLVFNPFIFDFLVAARGYGLASGFLLSAICLVAYAKKPPVTRPLVTACAGASVCIALSFLSNFSFAFVDAATIAVLYLWASGGTSTRLRLRLAAACFLPGLLVAGALAGAMLLRWPGGELTYGAPDLSDTFKSLYDASFYELNPLLRDSIIVDVPSIILLLCGVFVAWRTVLFLINWRFPRDARSRWSLGFATIPIVAVAVALILHSVVFRLARIPLPKDRTGIYVVVLSTLFLGSLAAVPIPTRAGELSRRGLTILMVVLGSYFLLCLRISYFKEWKWDSDTDKIYSILAGYNHACGLKDIAVNWRYDSSLNFYRIVSGHETIPVFAPGTGEPFRQYSAGKRAYVVYEPDDHDFLTEQALTVVHRFPSGAALAFDPEIEPPPSESACPLSLPDH